MIRIEIEGIDGSGKTTLVQDLAAFYRAHNKRVITVSETGFEKIPICVALKKLALDNTLEAQPLTLEYLFAAQRYELQEWMKENESNYDICISDRGMASHHAYAYAQCIPSEEINKLFNFGQEADSVVFLDVDINVAHERCKKRNPHLSDRMESKGLAFMYDVRDGYYDYLRDKNNAVIWKTGELSQLSDYLSKTLNI